MLALCAACVEIGHWLPKYWGGGLAGALGALFWGRIGKWFDRRWPQPKKGWAE